MSRPRPFKAPRCAPCLNMLEDRITPAITGFVFQDFNADGRFDGPGGTAAIDRGVADVAVTAYDSANVVVGNALSDALGNYVLSASGSGPYRIEFTGLPAGFAFGPQGVTSGSSIQFASGPNDPGLNLAVVRPEDFNPDNPALATSRYVFGGIQPGDLNYGQGVIQSFPYDAGANAGSPSRADYQNPTTHDLNVQQQSVGATWGLAYDGARDQLLAATFMKRTTGFGPNGPGAIYSLGTTGANATLFADLNAAFGDFPAGNLNSLFIDSNGNPVPYRTNIPDFNYWFFDGLERVTDANGIERELGWDSVGKLALGGLDVSADGATAYTMALGDRRLYAIPMDGLRTSATIERFHLPIPSTVTGITAGNPLGDLRPFAVEVHRGIVYVGAVNSAESTQNASDLRAYVFAFDPVAGTFMNENRQATASEAVFEFDLNYPRGNLHLGQDPSSTGATPPDPAEWNAWSPVHRFVQDPVAGNGRSGYPQPMLTGLSFDTDGNLTLGLRDRSGDQFGRNLPVDENDPNNYSYFSMTAGDTLRAFINNPGNLDAVQASAANFSGWTLESNGRDASGRILGGGTQNTGQGPGHGEFFYQDDFPHDPSTPPPGVVGPENDEVSTGGVLNLPGFNHILSTTFNPARIESAINAGGVRWYDSTTGAMTRAYELYVTVPATSGSTFAKGNGIGDLVAITGAAPIEIGNFVWLDDNANGVQDAGETGLSGITLSLFGPGGSLIATAITDANGQYIFSTAAGTSTTSRAYNLALTADTDYEIRVTLVDGFDFTSTFADASTNGTARDSNANAFGVVSVLTPLVGVSNHTFDIGLVEGSIIVPPPPPPPLFLPVSVSGAVFRDNCPADGILQPGELPFPGVRITLVGTTVEGPITRTTFTDANGQYAFLGLPPGTFTITESQPPGFYDSLDIPGTFSGAAIANDTLRVTLGDDQHATGYNFAEIAPNTVYGHVFNDVNRNTVFDSGDVGIPNSFITIRGTAFAGSAMARSLVAADSLGGLTARTDASGRWEFPSLPPGSYQIVQAQPAGLLDGNESTTLPNPGNLLIDNDAFTNVVLCSGAFLGALNFGEFVPQLPDLSKKNFLGSSGSGVAVPPGGTPPIFSPPINLPLQPNYDTRTGDPADPSLVVVAAGAGRSPLVRAFDFSTGIERFRFFAYEPTYLGGVRVATGDVDGDGIDDIVTATGLGGGPRVRVFSGLDGSVIRDFFAYEPEFRGGVFLAVGDVTGDGRADIVTGTEQGGGPRVTVFDAVTNERVRDFFAFDSSQRGGVRVAVADFNRDGKADIAATAGRGVQTRVRVFDAVSLDSLTDFVPYDVRFTGGVFLATGDVTGDGVADVVTGADVGGGPHVQVFDGLTGNALYGFFADDPDFRSGVRVALQDVDGDGEAEIVTALGPGGPARVKLWQTGAVMPFEDFLAVDASVTNGVYIG